MRLGSLTGPRELEVVSEASASTGWLEIGLTTEIEGTKSTMKTLRIAVAPDHLSKLARSRSPHLAISELIWNSLDADATQVEVALAENAAGGIETITVRDNGHGVPFSDAETEFGRLGGSWKATATKTKRMGRILHGKNGEGRFKVYALGSDVSWVTTFDQAGSLHWYSITGSSFALQTVHLEEPTPGGESTGTELTVSSLSESAINIDPERLREQLAQQFALYLRKYPDARILVAGVRIDPSALESRSYSTQVSATILGATVSVPLVVIEWIPKYNRTLHLCDSSGFTLSEIQPGIAAKNFNFTAYLQWDEFRTHDHDGLTGIAELTPELQPMIVAAKESLRSYFAERTAEESRALIDRWRREGVYPYPDTPAGTLETVERQVFDVCAVHVNDYLPSFPTTDPITKRLSLRLLREAIAQGPNELRRILEQVIELPKPKREELDTLLQRTTLSAIITASKDVADRLTFIRALELMLFSEDSKVELKERTQLHKIVESEAWLFGDQYSLSASDESLTDCLRAHRTYLGDDIVIDEPVHDVGGNTRFIDLMFSRWMSLPNSERGHLVVELKRPSKKLDWASIEQLYNYAEAVFADTRFDTSNTRWEFWALSNSMDPRVKSLVRQDGKPPGQYGQWHNGRLVIWAKTWGEIIHDAQSRLSYFKKNLEFTATRDHAIAFLHAVHAKYLPPSVAGIASPGGL